MTTDNPTRRHLDDDVIVQVRVNKYGRITVAHTEPAERTAYQIFVLRRAASAIRQAYRALEPLRQCGSCAYRPRKPGECCEPSGKHPRSWTAWRSCAQWATADRVVTFDPKRRRAKKRSAPSYADFNDDI